MPKRRRESSSLASRDAKIPIQCPKEVSLAESLRSPEAEILLSAPVSRWCSPTPATSAIFALASARAVANACPLRHCSTLDSDSAPGAGNDNKTISVRVATSANAGHPARFFGEFMGSFSLLRNNIPPNYTLQERGTSNIVTNFSNKEAYGQAFHPALEVVHGGN